MQLQNELGNRKTGKRESIGGWDYHRNAKILVIITDWLTLHFPLEIACLSTNYYDA